MYSKKILINEIDKAKLLINIASSYIEDIDLVRGRYVIDAKSVMGIFCLDLSKEITIVIHTDDVKIANNFFADLENAGIK